jgi:peroxiredoxin
MVQHTFLAALILLVLPLTPARAQTVDEIITKHIAAIGGIERLKSLESFAIISRSEHWSFNLYWKRPDRVRVEVLLGPPTQGRDVRAFDGTTGWRVNPMEGSEDPRRMSASETAELREQGEWWGELVDYQTKGYKVEYVGKELADGSPAYRLKLTKPGRAAVNIFLDEKTFLEVKRVRKARAPWGEDVEHITEFGNYRMVGGLMLPHSVGDAVREYEVNKPMDEALFKMPQPKSQAPGKAIEKQANNLTEQLSDPQRRAQLLKTNPEADLNKDGTLTLEEAWAYFKKDQAAQRLLPVGSPAPDWKLKDVKGQLHSLSDYRGKVVVMDFWAVWCIPCHRLMPGMQKLHDDLARRGVVVFGISTGERGGDPAQLMKDRGYTYGLLLNGETMAESYHVVGLPTVYVIGSDGRILHAGFGADEILEGRRRAFIEAYLSRQGK